MSDPQAEFRTLREKQIVSQGARTDLLDATNAWMNKSVDSKYSYHFDWLGRPIIQYPQDILAMQEIIWRTKPDLIVETGIAHGGSLIFSASMLELNAACGGPQNARVVGVDIDIRDHNKRAIEDHPMIKRIDMIQGSSIDPAVVKDIRDRSKAKQSVLVCLDSNHTHAHVLAELEAYAELATVGNYCVVFDTIIESQPEGTYPDRPWGRGDNPKTAIDKFLETRKNFEIDNEIDAKLLISVAKGGYLRRVSR